MNAEQLQPLSHQAQQLKQGVYEHYKGYRYKVLAVSRHSETLEEYVVYQALYGDGDVWIRPLAMFCEDTEWQGVCVPRFKCIQ